MFISFTEGSFTFETLDIKEGQKYAMIAGKALTESGEVIPKITDSRNYKDIEIEMLQALTEYSWVKCAKIVADYGKLLSLQDKIDTLEDGAKGIELNEKQRKLLSKAFIDLGEHRLSSWLKYCRGVLRQILDTDDEE